MNQTVLEFIPQERTTQKGDILDYLARRGSITRIEAALNLGIMELSSRVGELEKDGWIIPREWQRGIAKNGRKYAVMKYLTPYRGRANEAL